MGCTQLQGRTWRLCSLLLHQLKLTWLGFAAHIPLVCARPLRQVRHAVAHGTGRGDAAHGLGAPLHREGPPHICQLAGPQGKAVCVGRPDARQDLCKTSLWRRCELRAAWLAHPLELRVRVVGSCSRTCLRIGAEAAFALSSSHFAHLLLQDHFRKSRKPSYVSPRPTVHPCSSPFPPCA